MYDVKPITSPIHNDCGATCMCMLLSYYNMEANLKDIINECNTTIIGCTAKDLVRVGNEHGLDMRAYKMDAEQVLKQDRPSIVWWKYNHWCVFCGIDEYDNAVICNPDLGRYRMKKSTFMSFYSGVSLYNGEPKDNADCSTMVERLYETEQVAQMAYVNSEIALAMIELEV